MESRVPIPPAVLDEFLRQAGQALARHPEVLAAWLFGSSARGEPARDVDVGVLVDGAGTDPWLTERIAADLDRVRGTIRVPVDVRLLRGASPRFCATVLREGRLFFERSAAARIEFEARTWSEWLDFRPVWERTRRAVLERWGDG